MVRKIKGRGRTAMVEVKQESGEVITTLKTLPYNRHRLW